MSQDPYLPLFVGDFLASTVTWTGPERGLYLQLLCMEWASGPLPIDPDRLARSLHYSPEEFAALWSTVRPKFHNGDGALVNPRLEAIRTANLEHRQKRTQHAAKASRARWDQGKASSEQSSEQSSGECPGNAQNMPSTPLHSTPLQTTPKPSKNVKATRSEPPGWFVEFKAIYPRRAGDPAWSGGLRAAHARMAEGHSPGEFIAGARRYAAYIAGTGKQGSDFIQQASRFLGPGKPFALPWHLPAEAETDWDKLQRLNGGNEHGRQSRVFEAAEPGRTALAPPLGPVRG